MNEFVYTKAIDKLRRLKKRVRVIQGGTGAGKTYGIIPILIDYAIQNPKSEISIVSESVPHLRKGVLKDFNSVMEQMNIYKEKRMNKTFLSYKFENKSFIEFFSVDQEDKTRGPRRDILYINECNNVDFETYYQLAIRTNKIIWLDYNPVGEFWVHTELLSDPDIDFLTLTYKDNSALAPEIVKEIEKSKYRAYHNPDLPQEELELEANIKSPYWLNWWKVFGLGELGIIEGSIINDWVQVKEIPREAFILGYGLDFGYTNDPTAMVSIYRYNKSIYVNEELYQTGLTNQDTVDIFNKKGIPKNAYIVADSAEPKSIAEINRYGFRVVPAKKGADSVMYGINLLQKERLYITSTSTNLIKELRLYCWEKDRNGKTINRPIDAMNHLIDALRYIAMEKIGKKRRTGLILREF